MRANGNRPGVRSRQGKQAGPIHGLPGRLLTAWAFVGALMVLDAVILVLAGDFFRLGTLAVLAGVLLNLLVFALLLLSWIVGVLGHRASCLSESSQYALPANGSVRYRTYQVKSVALKKLSAAYKPNKTGKRTANPMFVSLQRGMMFKD